MKAGFNMVTLAEVGVILAVGGLAAADGVRIIINEANTVGGIEAGGWLIFIAALLVPCLGLFVLRTMNSGAGTWAEENLSEVIYAAALLMLYVTGLRYAGYVISTFLFMSIYIHKFSDYRLRYIIPAVALAVLLSNWLWVALDVRLPASPLPWL